MRLLAREHADRRRADQALLLDVPPDLGQDVVAGGGHRRRMRHLRARHERERPDVRQAQEVGDPGACDLFHDRRRRAGDVETGILVPGGRQPVGGERRRYRTADHEAEVPRARDRDRTGVTDCGELAHDLMRIGRAVGHRADEPRTELVHSHGGIDRTLGKALEEVGGQIGRLVQQLAHAWTLPAADLAERRPRRDRLRVDAQLDQRGPPLCESRLERGREVLHALDERRVRAERARIRDEVRVGEVGARPRDPGTAAPGACGSSRASRC